MHLVARGTSDIGIVMVTAVPRHTFIILVTTHTDAVLFFST